MKSNRLNGEGESGGGLSLKLPADILKRLEKSLKQQWKRHRKGLKRCQSKFSEKAIHDSRVETRRLLAMAELLGGFLAAGRAKEIARLLKLHLDKFDELRDTQVQLRMLQKLLRRIPAVPRFYTYLLKRERRFIKETRKAIKNTKIQSLAELIDSARGDLERGLEHNAASLAANILTASVDRAFARAQELQARIQPRDTTTIHRTRVAFKKFRYMIETLAPYVPAANDKLLASLHHYQTMMGDIQDAEMMLQAFDKFARKAKIERELERSFRDQLLNRRQRLIQDYLDTSGQLDDFWPLPLNARGRSARVPAGRKNLVRLRAAKLQTQKKSK